MTRSNQKYDSKQKFASFAFVLSYILAYLFCSYAWHDFDCMEWARNAIYDDKRDINPFALLFVPLLVLSCSPIIGGIVLLVHHFVELDRRRRIIAASCIGLLFPILSLSEVELAYTKQSLMVSLAALLLAYITSVIVYTVCTRMVYASRYSPADGHKV